MDIGSALDRIKPASDYYVEPRDLIKEFNDLATACVATRKNFFVVSSMDEELSNFIWTNAGKLTKKGFRVELKETNTKIRYMQVSIVFGK